MTRILAGALRDHNGVRVCPRGCTGETKCQAAKAKSDGPGWTIWTPPLPGLCSMFYDSKTKEPT